MRHKYYVGRECFRYKLFYRGIIHDLSKFSRSEFPAYRDRWNDPRTKGLVDEDLPEPLRTNYKRAWNRHQKLNDHHWQFWHLKLDRGPLEILEMSDAARIEMICDWIGAGKAYNSPLNALQWFQKNTHLKNEMHPITYQKVLDELTKRFGEFDHDYRPRL